MSEAAEHEGIHRPSRLLAVLAAATTVGVLLAVALPARREARQSQEGRWVRRDMARIANGIRSYHRHTQRLPIPASWQGRGRGVDEYTAESEADLLEVYRMLAGQHPPGQDFLRMEPARFLRDPWESSYLIKFDSNGNGLIEYWTDGEESLQARFLIVSAGPDRQRSHPKKGDDIVLAVR